jgi:hypothetical protein
MIQDCDLERLKRRDILRLLTAALERLPEAERERVLREHIPQDDGSMARAASLRRARAFVRDVERFQSDSLRGKYFNKNTTQGF